MCVKASQPKPQSPKHESPAPPAQGAGRPRYSILLTKLVRPPGACRQVTYRNSNPPVPLQLMEGLSGRNGPRANPADRALLPINRRFRPPPGRDFDEDQSSCLEPSGSLSSSSSKRLDRARERGTRTIGSRFMGSENLQTLRASNGSSDLRDSVWSACVFSAAFRPRFMESEAIQAWTRVGAMNPMDGGGKRSATPLSEPATAFQSGVAAAQPHHSNFRFMERGCSTRTP